MTNVADVATVTSAIETVSLEEVRPSEDIATLPDDATDFSKFNEIVLLFDDSKSALLNLVL